MSCAFGFFIMNKQNVKTPKHLKANNDDPDEHVNKHCLYTCIWLMMLVAMKFINTHIFLCLKVNSDYSDWPVNTWIRVKVLKLLLVYSSEVCD